MSDITEKKKYALRFGNKELPNFLVTKENIRKLIFFTTIYSLVFINIFRPFNSDSWIPGINTLNYFLYSSLMVLIGLALISVSRVIMYFFVKKISIGYWEYLIWILCEITILAGFYVFIAYKVGFIDNYIEENQVEIYAVAVFDIYRKAVANTTWMLLIPYIISYLYLYNEHLVRNVITKLNENANNEHVQPERKENSLIHFKDDRNEVRFSITTDKIAYIESSDNYCKIKYINNDKLQDFIIRTSLKKLQEELKDTSIQRCQRSYMVNFEHVVSLRRDNNDISLEFDVKEIGDIPVSKSYNDKVVEAFVTYSKQG
ncbi:MAG: LytTR family transcriptional regulator [Bacteroidales bacterium]|nr:LytTR family transcriptional regulator [Bacteroidales bacterium]